VFFQIDSLIQVILHCNEVTFQDPSRSVLKSYRARACGRRVIMVPIVLFADDTSGNTSKTWNKYESYFFTLAGLPFRLNQDLENVHFVMTSREGSAIDTSICVAESLLEMRNGVDAKTANGEKIVFVGQVLFLAADGPAHADLCNANTQQGLTPCRLCTVHKESPDYLSTDYPWKPNAGPVKAAVLSAYDNFGANAVENLKKSGIRDKLLCAAVFGNLR
jgi:hypothetical protein